MLRRLVLPVVLLTGPLAAQPVYTGFQLDASATITTVSADPSASGSMDEGAEDAPLMVVRATPSGDLRADLLGADGGVMQAVPTAGKERSVPLALALSAVVPGAGQAYNRSWIRTVVFGGIEAGLWTSYFVWKGQGEDGRDAYEAAAHAGWSPLAYAEWLTAYPGYPESAASRPALLDAITAVQAAGIDFSTPEAWRGTSREAPVRQLFTAINNAERGTRYTDTGALFSHTLPYFGEQQYYELIGKYFQYNPGWDDWYVPTNPAYTELPSVLSEVTPQFDDYRGEHADANTLLRKASRASSFVLANHLLAALDAAITARLHNLRLETDMALVPSPDGSVTTSARLRLTF